MQELSNILIYIYIYFTTVISILVLISAVQGNDVETRLILIVMLSWPVALIGWTLSCVLKRLDWAMDIQSNTKYFSYRKRPTGTGFGITIFTWEFQFWKMGT